MKAFVLLHTEQGALPKAALEVLNVACGLGMPFSVGILGQRAACAADTVAACGATAFEVVDVPEVAQPRYASDTAAAAALIRSAEADVVIAPQTSRFARCLPGVASRLGMAVDTHIVSVAAQDGAVNAQRWFYRQRILSSFSREVRPWMLLVDGGVQAPWQGAAGTANAQTVTVDFGEQRTTVTGIQALAADAQTIRPEAALLFVAGAGWTKKQKDGQFQIGRAGDIIQSFLGKAKASLGSSKSLVDLQSEGQETLGFMSHMNQVGQTGSTPRHPKGLSTCCHGEEPHAVGWRFITERRAINLDPNCGWAQGKADVVYVGDAFEIMEKVNALLGC